MNEWVVIVHHYFDMLQIFWCVFFFYRSSPLEYKLREGRSLVSASAFFGTQGHSRHLIDICYRNGHPQAPSERTNGGSNVKFLFRGYFWIASSFKYFSLRIAAFKVNIYWMVYCVPGTGIEVYWHVHESFSHSPMSYVLRLYTICKWGN